MDPRHERPHLDAYIPNLNWMENLYFGGLDDTQGIAFGVHLKLRPDQQRAEVRCFIEIQNDNCTFGGRYPLGEEFAYPIYTATCVEPFRHWRLKVDATGWAFPEVGGMMGLEIGGKTPTTPFGFELDIKQTLANGDWALFQGQASADSAGHGHYDTGIAWSGTLRIGERTVRASGLGIRDHSWGPRNFKQMFGVWFVGATYNEGRNYFAGLCLHDEEGLHGFSYRIDGDKVTLLPRPTMQVLEGTEQPGDFRKVLVTAENIKLTCNVRKHVLMPLLPERYLSADGFATVDTEQGSSLSYAMVERGQLYTAAQIDELKTRLGALS